MSQTVKDLCTQFAFYRFVLWQTFYYLSQVIEQRIGLWYMCQALSVVVKVIIYHGCIWAQMFCYVGQ